MSSVRPRPNRWHWARTVDRLVSASARSPAHSCPMARLSVAMTRCCSAVGRCRRGARSSTSRRWAAVDRVAAGLRMRECTTCSTAIRASAARRSTGESPAIRSAASSAARVIAWKSWRWKWQTAAASSVLGVGSTAARAAAGSSAAARAGPRGVTISGQACSVSNRPTSSHCLAAAACRTASIGSPWSANHCAARRCSSVTMPGCSRASRYRSRSRSSGWKLNQSVRPARPTSSALCVTSRSRVCWESLRPVSTSASPALSRSATLVVSRNCRSGAGSRSVTSSTRYSATSRSVPVNREIAPSMSVGSRDSRASRSPAAHPSVRSSSPLSCRSDTWISLPRNNSAASEAVNARSCVRMSVTSPLTRIRCRRSAGSARADSTSRSCGG